MKHEKYEVSKSIKKKHEHIENYIMSGKNFTRLHLCRLGNGNLKCQQPTNCKTEVKFC